MAFADLLPIVGVELGKHLGSVREALPLRSVCHEWRDTVTLGAQQAALDLEPDGGDAAARRELLLRRCPRLRRLTCHVAPGVSLAQFEADVAELARRLPLLEELELLFNNPAQQLETRHVAALSRGLPRLRSLQLQANFHPEACSFAPLQQLPRLARLAVLPSEASTGLTDAHVASLGALRGLEELCFPGHARAFSGATLGALAALPRLRRVAVAPISRTGGAAAAADYCLALPALAGLRALARRGPASPPLELELCVPDAAFGAALLRAAAGPGLRSVALSVREAADGAAVLALADAPGASVALAGLDVEFRAAPTADDVAALARCGALQRLHVTCKCPRAPPGAIDWSPWLGLRRLRHLHLHINPAWRAPLQPSAVAAMAAAWPDLEHLHLRLSPADNATYALEGQVGNFKRLRALSLTWLGQAGPAGALGARGANGARGGRGSVEAASFCVGGLPASLRELSLTSISGVRLVVPRRPAGAPPVLPALEALSLDGNFGLGDEPLKGLAAHAPNLASLTLVLAGRQALTADGLAAASASLPHLSALHVADYREAPAALSQACVAAVAAAGAVPARLRRLKLSTPDVVHAELSPAAFAPLTRLRRLDLVGCQDQAAAALGAQLPLCCMRPGPEWRGDLPPPPPVLPAQQAGDEQPGAAEAAAPQGQPPQQGGALDGEAGAAPPPPGQQAPLAVAAA